MQVVKLLANKHAAAAASERCDTRESTRLPTGRSERSVRLHLARSLPRSPACMYAHFIIGLLDSTSDFTALHPYGTSVHFYTPPSKISLPSFFLQAGLPISGVTELRDVPSMCIALACYSISEFAFAFLAASFSYACMFLPFISQLYPY